MDTLALQHRFRARNVACNSQWQLEAALGQVYERIEGGNTGAEWADDDVDDGADEANRPRDHEHDQPQDAPYDISHDVRSSPPSTNTMVKLPK